MAPVTSSPDGHAPASTIPAEKSAKREQRLSSSSHKSNVPTTFFLRSQEEMDASEAAGAFGTDSMFGVESLRDTINTADHMDSQAQSQAESQGSRPASSGSIEGPQLSMPSVFDHRPQLDFVNAALYERPPSLSRAPHLQHSPTLDSGPLSTPKSSSIRSFRLSDDEFSVDEASSQALASSDDGEEENVAYRQQTETGDMVSDAAAPQLVMPSIRMPARRPFTQNGKNLGKLKIMLAGAEGSGKTSLIRSIVQICDDIVHVDPLETLSPRKSLVSEAQRLQGKYAKSKLPTITEVHASTRPYPAWWAELDESRVLKRRKSFTETILERNVSFVDTQGFPDDRSSFTSHTDSVVNYIQNHLHRNASLASLNENELLGILSGNGGFQVDLILYVLDGVPDEAEMSFIKTLSSLCNLVPVISKADQRSSEECNELQQQIAQALRKADVTPFALRKYGQINTAADEDFTPFAVSCASSRDDENMDASLLMSSGYIEPLAPSELGSLVSTLFEPDMAGCLRHSASKKYIQWHRSFSVHAPSLSLNTIRPGHLPPRSISSPSPQLHYSGSSAVSARLSLNDAHTDNSSPYAKSTGTSSSGSSPVFPLLPATTTTNPYALARITDHTQREERLAQAHLARWAVDLQRALRNERARFAALQQGERQAWLQERLEECVSIDACRDGKPASDAIMLRTAAEDRKAQRSSSRQQLLETRRMAAQDPLGLVRFQDSFSRRGLYLAQVVGGAGVVGAVVVWVLKTWGWELGMVVDGGFEFRGAGSWSWTRGE